MSKKTFYLNAKKIKVTLYPTELAEEMKNLKQTLQVISDNLEAKGDRIDMLDKNSARIGNATRQCRAIRSQSQLTHQRNNVVKRTANERIAYIHVFLQVDLQKYK